MSELKSCKIPLKNQIDLEGTLFSGQTFRWNKFGDAADVYWGVIANEIVILRQEFPDAIEVMSVSMRIGDVAVREYFHDYFTLDINTANLFAGQFRVSWPRIWSTLEPYLGVRLLRQAPFEAMVSFMCAQGIGMGLIRRQVAMIAGRYGQPVEADTPWGCVIGHRFPTPEELASASVDDLSPCTNNNRVRAANIIAMARAVVCGSVPVDREGCVGCTTENLKDSLCRMNGIGMKIADCIALFGFGRFDAFPIDTHVRQYLRDWFGLEAARKSLTHANYLRLQAEAGAILDPASAGYAGHILFHCWRKEVRRMTAY